MLWRNILKDCVSPCYPLNITVHVGLVTVFKIMLKDSLAIALPESKNRVALKRR